MSGIVIVILLFVVLPLIAAAAYYSYLQQQRRIAELSALAVQNGWHFDAAKNYSHDGEHHQFSVFNQGHSRFAYNTMRGTLEASGGHWPILLGDYHYKITSGSGKNRSTQTYRFSYAIVALPYANLPELTIRHEGFFDKVAGFFGFDDIDFESAEFSDRFSVKGSDKKFAYDVIDPRMMQFLLSSNPPTAQLAGGACCIYDSKQCWTPEQFRGRVDWLESFFGHWPRHVVDSLVDRSTPIH